MVLEGKKVLLIAPKFFGYELHIRSKIESMGAKVTYLRDRPFDKAWQVALAKYTPIFLQPFADGYYQKNIDKLSKQLVFDFIFIINGQTVSIKTLKKIRQLNPNAKHILYMWDSVKNRPNVTSKFGLFDRILTFDPSDSTAHQMIFRPLFFIDDYRGMKKVEIQYDLSFIGSMHSDRYHVIKQVMSCLSKSRESFFYLYIQSKWVYWIYKIINRAYSKSSQKEFKFKPISKDLLNDIFSKSNAILDIEHPLQKGLTIRTFETLAAEKKLVTTNQDIKKYDFYNPNNIFVLDRRNIKLDTGFLLGSYVSIKNDIYDKYTLDAWINDIFE